MPGEIAALLSALCYALSYMLLRKGQAETPTDNVDNGLFTVLLVGGVPLGLGLIVRMFLNPKIPLLSVGDWKLAVGFCILSGLFGTLFGRLALFAAIARIGATRGVTINMMATLVTLAIAVMVLGEKLRLFDFLGMNLLIISVVLLLIERVFFPDRSTGMFFNQGITAAVIAVLFQGIGHAFRKVAIDTSMTALLAATLDTLSALLVYVLILVMFGRVKRVLGLAIKSMNLSVIAAGLMSSAAVLLFYSASDSIPVSQVSVITGIQPVIVAVLSAIFMRNLERVSWVTFVCALLATLGVVIIAV